MLPGARIDIPRRKNTGISPDESDMAPVPPPELEIGLNKLFYIIIKAREFDTKVEPLEMEGSSSFGLSLSVR
jgi:hypothetical protein